MSHGYNEIEITDRAGKSHNIAMAYESKTAARAARDQILQLLNWLVRESLINYGRIIILD